MRFVDGERRIDLLQWGLVPWWAKDIRIAGTMINVRPDWLPHYLTTLPAPIDQRCLVLADGFYEWRVEGEVTQPYYFSRRDGSAFAFAGFWARNTLATGTPIESCAIAVVTPLHHAGDPYPLMGASLTPLQAAIWLAPNATTEQLRGCLKAVDPTMFRAWPVAPQVNSSQIDGPACVQPMGAIRSALDIMPPS